MVLGRTLHQVDAVRYEFASALVAQSLEDGFLNTSLRLTGLDVALIQNGRLVAATTEGRP